MASSCEISVAFAGVIAGSGMRGLGDADVDELVDGDTDSPLPCRSRERAEVSRDDDDPSTSGVPSDLDGKGLESVVDSREASPPPELAARAGVPKFGLPASQFWSTGSPTTAAAAAKGEKCW